MYRGNDDLVYLKQREILFDYGCAFDQEGSFENLVPVIDDFRPGFTVFIVAVMRRIAGFMFDRDMMTVAYQYADSFGGQRNPIFLEGRLFGDPNVQLRPFRLYIKGFFKGLVTERGADNWSLLGHFRNLS